MDAFIIKNLPLYSILKIISQFLVFKIKYEYPIYKTIISSQLQICFCVCVYFTVVLTTLLKLPHIIFEDFLRPMDIFQVLRTFGPIFRDLRVELSMNNVLWTYGLIFIHLSCTSLYVLYFWICRISKTIEKLTTERVLFENLTKVFVFKK